MMIDGMKVKSARDRRALTQEALAHQARVNVRTIQRAECGEPIRHETLADIAAALGIPPAALLRSEATYEADGEQELDTTKTQVLKRAERGDTVIALLERAVMAVIDCTADPTETNMPSLKAAITALEAHIGNVWDENNRLPLRFDSLLTKLEATVALNSVLVELERAGLALYCAASTELVKVPQMHEEGLAISYGQRPRYATAARFVIANYENERLRVRADVIWPLQIEPEPEPEVLDDELPF